MLFYLKDGFKSSEAVNCANVREALAIARERNRKDKGANWKVYTQRGDLVYQCCIHGHEIISY